MSDSPRTAAGSAPGGGTATPAAAIYCDRCGKPLRDGGHERCARERQWEPPRYCPQCARRMVVQIDPVGWWAKCSRHGELTPPKR